jgi:hypothetical protein
MGREARAKALRKGFNKMVAPHPEAATYMRRPARFYLCNMMRWGWVPFFVLPAKVLALGKLRIVISR